MAHHRSPYNMDSWAYVGKHPMHHKLFPLWLWDGYTHDTWVLITVMCEKCWSTRWCTNVHYYICMQSWAVAREPPSSNSTSKCAPFAEEIHKWASFSLLQTSQPLSWGHLGAINESTQKKHDCNILVPGHEIQTSNYLLNPDSPLLSDPSIRAVPWLWQCFGNWSDHNDQEGPDLRIDIRTKVQRWWIWSQWYLHCFPTFLRLTPCIGVVCSISTRKPRLKQCCSRH